MKFISSSKFREIIKLVESEKFSNISEENKFILISAMKILLRENPLVSSTSFIGHEDISSAVAYNQTIEEIENVYKMIKNQRYDQIKNLVNIIENNMTFLYDEYNYLLAEFYRKKLH